MLFLSSRGKKIKNITNNWTKEIVFVYIIGFIFMAFLTQKQIYTINMI